MKCPFCSKENLKVLESREVNGNKLRRRRECSHCSGRFTTYEVIEAVQPRIIKKDGRIERFNKEKIFNGVLTACEKRPVTTEQVTMMIQDIENTIKKRGKTDIKSKLIGNMVMNRIKKVDKVAFLRFASVYMDFSDLESFEEVIQKLKED